MFGLDKSFDTKILETVFCCKFLNNSLNLCEVFPAGYYSVVFLQDHTLLLEILHFCLCELFSGCFGESLLSHHRLRSEGLVSVQLLYRSQVGFGQVLFDRGTTASGHLVVVRND